MKLRAFRRPLCVAVFVCWKQFLLNTFCCEDLKSWSTYMGWTECSVAQVHHCSIRIWYRAQLRLGQSLHS